MKPNRCVLFFALVAVCLLNPLPASADGTRISTNQSYIEDAWKTPEFAIEDKFAVLSLVLGSLGNEAVVYPTENYFYFSFSYKGIKYAGNIRFDIEDRDQGFIHFTYFKDFTDWQHDEAFFGDTLGEKQGVSVKPAGKLAYTVEFKGRKVLFKLNDLSGVKPPANVIGKQETYIGPVADESGIRFFLVFNKEMKVFHFILDETVPVADQFNPIKTAKGVSIGIRTGFAFYDDRFAPRKILVGVHQANTWVNNYLDGPFDQLPDNFLVGETLRDAILAESPDAKGQIDRFGNYADGDRRYLVAPYMQYEEEGELSIISDCAAGENPPVYYKCFSFTGAGGEEDDGSDTGKPDAPQ